MAQASQELKEIPPTQPHECWVCKYEALDIIYILFLMMFDITQSLQTWEDSPPAVVDYVERRYIYQEDIVHSQTNLAGSLVTYTSLLPTRSQTCMLPWQSHEKQAIGNHF